MRFDLLINELVRDAFIEKEIMLLNPRAWRPFVHISDVVRAIEITVNAKSELTEKQIFNVGGVGSNIRKCGLADRIKEFLPDTNIGMFEGKDIDPRNYSVSFKKIHDILDYSTQITIKEGIKEIIDALKLNTFENPGDDIFKSVLK
jgi:nucleoside-diphosphate-sugar epimerase